MKILAVGAHLDDIEISAGGLLADAVLSGHEVVMIAMSESENTDIDGNMVRSREVAIREGNEAATILGVERLEIFDFSNKDMPYDSSSVGAIERVLIDLQPDIIVSHWPHDTHQAHRATGLASISAARRKNRLMMFEPMAPSGRSYEAFRPQMYHAVSEEGRRRKNDALRAHASEYERLGRDTWVGAVDARGVHRGFEIGTPYAEAFEVVRWELDFSS